MSDLINIESLEGETRFLQGLKSKWKVAIEEADQEDLLRLMRFASAGHIVFTDEDLIGLFNRKFLGVSEAQSKKIGFVGNLIGNLDTL